eukprot:6588471-Karenia_brevis.AAC.1
MQGKSLMAVRCYLRHAVAACGRVLTITSLGGEALATEQDAILPDAETVETLGLRDGATLRAIMGSIVARFAGCEDYLAH